MQKYQDYQPTGFDDKGYMLDEQQHWLVLPCGRNRDSDPLDESNFQSAIDTLGGESDVVEIHRFGHWACGWFEVIIVQPDTPQADIAEEIEAALADYPVLDEQDHSEREWDYATEVWNNCFNLGEKVELCKEYEVSIFAARHDRIPNDNCGGLFDYLRTP